MGRERIGLVGMARDALDVMGQQVAMARRERQMTIEELAARAGVSGRTVRSVERGDAAVSFGNVLRIAVAAGVPVFGAETPAELAQLRRLGQDRLALLPTRVRRKEQHVDTDF